MTHSLRRLVLAFLMLGYWSISQAACPEGCPFRPGLPLATELPVRVVATGDVNGDQRTDIAALAESGYDTLYVFLQSADGGFGPPLAYGGFQGQAVFVPNAIAIGDVNGDGRSDIVATIYGGFRMLYQDAQGQLSQYQDYKFSVSKLRLADVNHDGRTDVIALSVGGGVSVFLQASTGELAAPIVYAVDRSGWKEIEVGDVNHDGRPDLALINAPGANPVGLDVLLQNGAGGFDPPVHYDVPLGSDGHGQPSGLAIGDVTGDGLNDVVISDSMTKKILVFVQNTGGTLDAAAAYDSGNPFNWPSAVTVADMNQDGRSDVVALLQYGIESVLMQKSDGTLASAITQVGDVASSDPDACALAVADLNGDGKLDAVIATDVNLGGVDVLYGNRAGLRLSVTPGQSSALVAQDVRYTAKIVNDGPDVATAVRFSFSLPSGMYSRAPIATSQGSCDDAHYICQLGAMAPGQIATVVFDAFAISQPGQYVINASIGAYGYDSDMSNNLVSIPSNVTQGADIAISSHTVSMPSGGQLMYAVTVVNNSQLQAQGVVLHDTLASSLAPMSASWREVWGGTRTGTCSISGSSVDCALDTLSYTDVFAGGYPVVVSINARINDAGELLSTASVSSATGDPDTSNNSSSRLSDVNGVAVNQPPTIVDGGPYIARVGASLSLNAAASHDPENGPLSFDWTFPDGTTASYWSTHHVFTTPGVARVSLVARDQDGGTATDTFGVNVINAPPVALLKAPYQLQRKNNQVLFDATPSYDLDGGPLAYTWDFGDGSSSSGAQAVHTYLKSGQYSVTMSVSDGATFAVARSSAIVTNAAPVADPGSSYSGSKNQPISFDGSYSRDADGDALSYRWNFGDGTSGTGARPVYSYTRGGLYTVSLTVNDGEVDSLPASTTVTVTNHVPVANVGGPYSVVKGKLLTLDGSASSDADNDSLTYRWNFGDGTTGAGVMPTHTYPKNGRYTVTLIVNDGEVDSAPSSAVVSVSSK